MNINWNAAPDMPAMYDPRQELFYKVSCDKKRLYVFDDGVWKQSKHEPDSFFKWESPVRNPVFDKFIETISLSEIDALWLWCKSGIGRGKRLAAWIGVTPAMITNICAGRKELPIEKITAVSDYTGIPARLLRPDIAELFGINPRPTVNVDSKELADLRAIKENILGKGR